MFSGLQGHAYINTGLKECKETKEGNRKKRGKNRREEERGREE